MNPNSTPHDEPLFSIYAGDVAIADILPFFLNNVPKYLDNLENHIATADWDKAARVCHDLKGTAGGYGYPDIGAVARVLEAEVKGPRSKEALDRHLAEAKTLCRRAKMALPSDPISSN